MKHQSITIRDPATGAEAEILVSLGFNCFRFTAQMDDGPCEVLWAADDFSSGAGRPSGSGIPILFPFPGRIRGARFEYEGRAYSLPEGDGRGNAIHGFALDRPWQLVEHGPSHAMGVFHGSQVDAALAGHWPADFRLYVEYRLRGNALESRLKVENPDDRPLPWGLGTHPYFRVPPGGRGEAAACRVTVPAARYWELAELLPTGRCPSVASSHDLRSGRAFADTQLDDVLTALDTVDGMTEARIESAPAGRRLLVRFDSGFRHAVVYNPPHREAICIEPYTSVPDPFTLAAEGIESNLAVLAPGESVERYWEIRLE